MTKVEEQVKRIEGTIERRLNEHLQMLVMLEKCTLTYRTLATLGNVTLRQANEILRMNREIEALLQKVRTP